MKPGFALKLKKKKKQREKLHLSINRRQSTGIDVKNSSKLRERDTTGHRESKLEDIYEEN